MAQKPKSKKRPVVSNSGPIKPDTPLYRLLEMIAREIAKHMDTDATPVSKRSRNRR